MVVLARKLTFLISAAASEESGPREYADIIGSSQKIGILPSEGEPLGDVWRRCFVAHRSREKGKRLGASFGDPPEPGPDSCPSVFVA